MLVLQVRMMRRQFAEQLGAPVVPVVAAGMSLQDPESIDAIP